MTLAIRGRDGQPDIEWRQDGTANAVLTPNGGRAGIGVGAIAIQAGATRENPLSGPDGVGVQKDIAYTLEARQEVQAVQSAWAVRRLTPTECHRLQGFRDGFCNIPWRGKPEAPDGPQYKALGNSMAVNVMRWIGRRIEMVEEIMKDIAA
jgi:DNA (cytosine-5)-methyltransferase 1